MIECYVDNCADNAVLDLAGSKICQKHYNRLRDRPDNHELLPDVSHMLLTAPACTGGSRTDPCKESTEAHISPNSLCAYHFRLISGDTPEEARRRSDVYHAEKKIAAQNAEIDAKRERRMDAQAERILAREANPVTVEPTIAQLVERIAALEETVNRLEHDSQVRQLAYPVSIY